MKAANLIFSILTVTELCPLLSVSSQELMGNDFQSEHRVGKRNGDELLPSHSSAVPGLLVNRLSVRCRGQEWKRPRRPSFLGTQRGNLHPPATERVRIFPFVVNFVCLMDLCD